MNDIDSMEAGREIDWLIEKHVMGREPTETEISRNEESGMKVIRINYPSFSGSIEGAWPVIEKLRSVNIYLLRLTNGDTNYACWLGAGLTGGWAVNAVADTAPLAICRAALKNVGRNQH